MVLYNYNIKKGKTTENGSKIKSLMRIRKKAWTEEEIKNNMHIIQNPKEFKGRWYEYFGNTNPVFIEIGCGKGRFIFQNAVLYPEVNFIGIERQSTIMAIAARKIQGDLKNIALINGDAEGLEEFFKKGEVKRIYLNFSDPWPKKKWYKRRLTYRGFLQKYKELFEDYGEVFFKTDNSGLFEFSLNEFCADDWKLSNISLDLHKSDFEGNIMTEYEEKFSSQGMPIYRLEARIKV